MHPMFISCCLLGKPSVLPGDRPWGGDLGLLLPSPGLDGGLFA